MSPFDLRHPFATTTTKTTIGGGHHTHHHLPPLPPPPPPGPGGGPGFIDYPATAAALNLSLSLAAASPPAHTHLQHWEPGPPATGFNPREHHERNQDRYSPPPHLGTRKSVGGGGTRRSIAGGAGRPPPATVVGNSGGYVVESAPRVSRRERERRGERESYRERERDRERDRDNRERDRDVFFRENNLKQRLERKPSASGGMSGIGAGYSRTSHRQQQHAHTSSSSHHRARSLSLSRTTTSSSPDLARFRSMGLEEMVCYESDEGDEGYDEGDGADTAGRQHHRPRRRAGAGAAAAYGNGNASGGGVAKYYAQHERLSMSSPRVTLGGAGWPVEMATPVLCRPGSQSPESRGERIKYLGGSGQGSVYNAFDSGNENGLRMGLQRLHGLDAVSGVGVNKLPNPRVPSARRSGSFETVRGGAATEVGRKTRRSSPGKRANSKFRPQYKEVRVLIITWSFHDLRAEDYTAPPAADYVSLEDETKRLKETLGSYGYKISEFDIPMDHSVEKTKAKLKEFCRYANEDTLLMVYYHGHGSMDEENELVFSSHDHPDNAEWSQAAAAELYAALFPDEACPNVNGSHGRKSKIKELKKKYERYRPVSSIRWDTIREPLLSAPCDVLFILDCCAAGGANLRHVDWQPPSGTQFTKHLFAACGFESSTSDDMTAAMCEVLDQWVHEGASTGTTVNGIVGIGGGLSQGPAPGSGVLTTKRLHQLMEDRLQKRVVGSQPIFKQLLPHDPEQYITLPNLRDREMIRERRGSRSGTSVRGYVLT